MGGCKDPRTVRILTGVRLQVGEEQYPLYCTAVKEAQSYNLFQPLVHTVMSTKPRLELMMSSLKKEIFWTQ